METIEFNGIISRNTSDYDNIMIGDKEVSERVEDIDGQLAKLKYYIYKTPIDKNSIVEQYLKSFYEGATEADGGYVNSSSWTGVYAKRDKFKIGGHDIIEELSSYLGMYCYLIIEINNNNSKS